jgi:hypothetical protein
MIQVKKTTLTSAEIIAMFTNPQIILPTPVAVGKINNILGVSSVCNKGTIPYATGSNTWQAFFYGSDGVPPLVVPIFTQNNIISSNAIGDFVNKTNVFLKSQPSAGQFFSIFSTISALYLRTTIDLTPPPGPPVGNGTLDIFVCYEERDLV